MSTVLLLKETISRQLKAGMKDSWCLVRSPDSLYLGLKKKWLVPLLLLCSLVLVPTVLVPASHRLLELFYPPVEKSQLFGLFTTTREDVRLDARKVQAAWVVWGFAGLAVAAGLVAYAPVLRGAAEREKLRLLKTLQEALGGPGPFSLEERYRIDGELGSGAMGVVFKAFDKTLQREVALKELPPVFTRDTERRERFRREALTLARLTHPGIVSIYDLLDDGQRMVLIMELVPGGTLAELIARRAPVPVPEACRLVAQVCETLGHVHQNGILHRDLKPANILIDEQQRLKVSDFGMARLMQESGLTLEGSIVGTPAYMSPEQAAGEASDFRSDIYSLGVIFYELLAGTPPFTGEAVRLLQQQVADPPPPLRERVEGVSEEIEALVMSMLTKDPRERLSDYREISSRLKLLQG